MGLGTEYSYQNRMSASLNELSSNLICEVFIPGRHLLRDVACSHALFNSSWFLPGREYLPSSSNETSTTTNSTLLQGSSFDDLYLRIYRHCKTNDSLQSLHKPIEFALPGVTRLSKVEPVEVITNALEALKKAKLTPLVFLLDRLGPVPKSENVTCSRQSSRISTWRSSF